MSLILIDLPESVQLEYKVIDIHYVEVHGGVKAALHYVLYLALEAKRIPAP